MSAGLSVGQEKDTPYGTIDTTAEFLFQTVNKEES
jgi:hypothetical protein